MALLKSSSEFRAPSRTRMRKHTLLILALLGLFATELSAEDPVVPEGVRYERASEKVNELARQKIQKLFTAKATDAEVLSLFDNKLLICGPTLWMQVKKDPAMAQIKAGEVGLRVPIFDAKGAKIRTDRLEGKLFQSKEQVLGFWKVFAKQADFTDLKIRKLNPTELSVFWSMISFDITEPIFIVEGKRQKILLSFASSEDLKVSWIDDYQKARLQQDDVAK
jgi:hypothetical protein